MTTIELPAFGIIVELDGKAGSISSNLQVVGDDPEDTAYNSAIHGIVSLVLAHACAGVDIKSPAYLEGLETAIDTVSNQ